MTSNLRSPRTHILSCLSALVLVAGLLIPSGVQAQEFPLEEEGISWLQTGEATDEVLIEKATKLLRARANVEISHSTYADGVHHFKTHHPEFYGAFFGDPFFAGYDTRYFELANARRVVNLDVNPSTGSDIFNSEWLFCHPYSYDPAFNGVCRGFAFPRDEFWILPTFALLAPQDQATRRPLTATLSSEARVDQQVDVPDERPRPQPIRDENPAPDRPDEGSEPSTSPTHTFDRVDPVSGADIGAAQPIEVSNLKPIRVPRRAPERTTVPRDRYDDVLRDFRRQFAHPQHRARTVDRPSRAVDEASPQQRRARRQAERQRTIERVNEAAEQIERRRSSGESSGSASGQRARRSGGEKENEHQ